jgi:nitroreductase
MTSSTFAAKKSKPVTDYLLKRRSTPIKHLCEPGPTEQETNLILQIAARTPDHGKLFPWYFVLIKGQARAELGKELRDILMMENADTPEAKLELEEKRFLRAPLVIAVISKIRKGKHPAWEQILSAGAVCQNLGLAANACGYGCNWLTEWFSYNETFRSVLGLSENEHIAGFLYIGSIDVAVEDRPRPELEAITSSWEKGKLLNKGEIYERENMSLPRKGFHLTLNDENQD